ncbi:MAG: SDR family oxidoreductase [Clostridia bacterium]|nr:SDR family oxidoreductase [Clostridia bacterium]
MKTALITGASGGIGLAIAELLCEHGYAVIAGYNHNGSKLTNVALSHNGRGHIMQPLRIDVTDDSSVNDAMRYAIDTFGRLDVLINCAGISKIAPLGDLDDWQKIIDTNLCGTIRACKCATPLLIKTQGNIINISSVWGDSGASCETVYSATKGGVNAFTRSLARELGIMGVRVNAVAPGYIDTEMNASLPQAEVKRITDDIPLPRAGAPKEVAETVLFLASDKASYITGQIITVDGGWTV